MVKPPLGKYGLNWNEIAREIVSASGSEFPDVYLITPFLHFDCTCELARFARKM
jgi:hypothetical protein